MNTTNRPLILAVAFALLAPAALAQTSTGRPTASATKGAAVGAVAGHMAGHHAVAGAVAGAAIGHHERNKQMRQSGG